jgi:hypothetical protein
MSRIWASPSSSRTLTGADAIIGFEYAAKQLPADGYTLVIAAVSGLATLVDPKDPRFDRSGIFRR